MQSLPLSGGAGTPAERRGRSGALRPWPAHLAVVADEHHAVARVYGPGAEVTLLYTHVERAWGPTIQTPSVRGSDVAPSQEVVLFQVPDPEVANARLLGPWESVRT